MGAGRSEVSLGSGDAGGSPRAGPRGGLESRACTPPGLCMGLASLRAAAEALRRACGAWTPRLGRRLLG